MMAGLYGATRLGDMGAEAMRRLADADVIAAPVLAYPKTVCDPQVAHNRMKELGYSDSDVARLRAAGTVRVWEG